MNFVPVTCVYLFYNDLVMAFFDTELVNSCVRHFGNSSLPVVVF